MRELEENAIAYRKSGAFLRPHLQHLQILCTSLHYPTLSPSIIQAYLFITITLYLLWIFGDDQNAFSRWLTFLRSPLPWRWRYRQKPTLPLPPAGSRLVGENKFHVVENDGGSLEAIAKNITSAFSLCYRLTPALILTYRARAAC